MISVAEYTISVVSDGPQGPQGATGEQGAHIATTRRQYCVLVSSTTPTAEENAGRDPGWVYVEPTDYDEAHEYIWGRFEFTMSDGSIEYSEAIHEWTVDAVTSIVDKENRTIKNRVWQTSYMEVDGLSGSVRKTLEDIGTESTQTTQGFNWLASWNGTSSQLEFTQAGLQLINGSLTITDEAGTNTVISGGYIQADSITADLINTDAIKSRDYTDTDNTDVFSDVGTWFSLANTGFIRSKNFAIDTDGNAYFRGNIDAESGTIGNWNIGKNALYGTDEDYTVVLQNTIAPYIQYVDNGDGTYGFDFLREGDDMYIRFVYEESSYIDLTQSIRIDIDFLSQVTFRYINNNTGWTRNVVREIPSNHNLNLTNAYITQNTGIHRIEVIIPVDNSLVGEHHTITLFIYKNKQNYVNEVDVMREWSDIIVYGDNNQDPYSPVVRGLSPDMVFAIQQDDGEDVNLPFYIHRTGKLYASKAELGSGSNRIIIDANDTDSAIYYGMNNYNSSDDGFYLGTNGLAIGGGNFKLSNDGLGNLACWNITKNCLYTNNGYNTVILQNIDIPYIDLTDNGDGTFNIVGHRDATGKHVDIEFEYNNPDNPIERFIYSPSFPGYWIIEVETVNGTHTRYDERIISSGEQYSMVGSLGKYTYIYCRIRFMSNVYDTTNETLQMSLIPNIEDPNTFASWTNITYFGSTPSAIQGVPNDVAFGIRYKKGSTITMPFYVDMTGKLYAQNAELNGTIDATTGAIGGWNVGANTLSNSTYILDSSGSTTTTINGTSRPNLVFSIGNNFGVSSSGTLYTGGATINGSITATSLTAQTTYQIYTGNTTKDVINIGTFTTGDFSFTNGIKIGNITDQAYWSCGDGGMSGKIISAGNNTSVYAKNFNGSTSVGAPTVYVNTLDTATTGVTTITCNAKLSGRITNADSASYADSAGSATNATNASYATSAGSATSANYATSAGSATSASSATTAGSAEYAEVAHKCKDNAQNNNRTPNCFIADDMRILKFINSSSREVKNIVCALDFEKYDEDIYNISTYWFKYKSEYLEKNGIKKEDQIDEVLYGFIAEDWEKYFPEAVIYNDDGTVENWNERSVIAFMFEMIKKEHKANKELKKDIEELKQIINELRRE